MKLRLIQILLFVFVQNIVFAQNGPGGFGDTTTSGSNNIILWLDANTISQTDGTTVSAWNDLSNESNNSSSPSSNEPVFETNELNGYPTVRFTAANSDYLTISNDASLNPNRISYFIVGSYTSNTSGFSPFIIKTTDNSWTDGYGFVKDNSGDSFSAFVDDWNTEFTSGDIAEDTNTIIQSSYNQNRLRLRYNDFNQGNTNITNSYTTSNSPLLIGASPDAVGTGIEDHLDGDIAEIIIVNTQMRSSWRKIINNYLSAKYNIDIRSGIDDYTMDDPVNGNYDHKVAGIGSQTSSPTGLNKIETSKGTGIVEISNASSLDNGDYLYWGENLKDANYNFSTTTDYLERIDTKWRVSEVGNVGTVTMSFDISLIDLTGKQSCSDLTLVVSNDNFVANRTEYTLTISGSIATATGVSIADADYFTLEYIDQIVLDGTTFYNGSGTGNAPNTTDDCYKLLIKNTATGATAITENAEVREVEVEAGGNLAVTTGNYLQITNSLTLNGDIRLVGNAQIIQTHTGGNQVTGTGDLYIDQASSIATANSIYRYTYWSSPVVNTQGDTTYTVANVMKDGTTATSALGGASEAQNINFIAYTGSITTANGSPTNPITIANYWIHTYTDGYDNSGFTQQLDNGNIDVGLGYLMKGSGSPTGQNFTFVGLPNDGTININITNTNDNNNIIGNPYPSAIDANQFMLDNSSIIKQEIYFWQHKGEATPSDGHNQSGYIGGYTVLNRLTGVGAIQPGLDSGGTGVFTYDAPGNYIPVGQGFLVTAENTGNIVFQNSQRAYQSLRTDTPSGDSFFFGRTASRDDDDDDDDDETPILRLGFEHTNLSGIELHRQIVVGFKEDLSFGYDNGFDSRMYDSRTTEIYWKFPSDENRYIITGVEEFDEDLEIPIDIVIGQEQPVKIMVDATEHFDDEEDIYLKDVITGQFHDISETVELNLPVGTYSDRFFITFNQSGVLNTEDVTAKNTTVFYDNTTKEIVIKATENIQIERLVLYNLLGQKITSHKVTSHQNSEIRVKTYTLSKAIYLVNITTKKGSFLRKVIVN